MCAINGFNFNDRELVLKMNKVTKHRGPDDTGVFLDEHISLGHNRLSIIDLSQNARQPMTSNDGNLVIVFNGEIYNFKELKEELKGEYEFKTESDTEVILAGYLKYKEAIAQRLNGIFAFAIWDKAKKELFLARDHIGVKPLYYCEYDEKFVFSSEIKGILEHSVPRKLNSNAFNTYLRVLYVPEPMTMFENIKKLPPASCGVLKNGRFELKKYWNGSSFGKKKSVSTKEIQKRVSDSVKKQLISDRPLGLYLSGGIDSSVILDSMKEFGGKVETFSVGFALKEDQEREKFNKDFNLARRTAEFYKTKHHEVLVKPEDVWDAFEKAIWHLDEPVSNSTIVPMIILSEFAKEKVAVVLSGDGGDELFGGYERYRLSLIQDYYQKLPKILRKLMSVSEKFKKLGITPYIDKFALYMFQKDDLLKKAVGSRYLNNYPYKFFKEKYFNQDKNFIELFMETDRKSWLVDEDLVRADKMGMASGLEVRVPFLDKNLVEFAESLPLSQKVSVFDKKVGLKRAFNGRIPAFLLKEPKRGWFSPGAKWLREPEVLSKVKEVLSPQYYEETKDLFNWPEIQNILREHIDKKEYNLTLLWSVISFQIWAKIYNIEL